jgi:PKHD-type hydroxylase
MASPKDTIMNVCIAGIVPASLLDEARAVLARARLVDGAETAGWHARLVKRNLQADPSDAAVAAVRRKIVDCLMANEVFRSAALPRAVRPPMLNRYLPGMAYGAHVDNAIMDERAPMRADISVTVFLGVPEAYNGGELVLETTSGETAYKLPAGHAVVYPTTTLHRVEPVTHGERDVAVTWVQSLVRSAERREVLFDLDALRRALFEQQGKSPTFDKAARSYANLLRMWAET